MKRFLCLHFANWSIQRLTAAQPALRGRPILVHQRDARRGELVVACSASAFEAGVRVGMALAEAAAILNHALRRVVAVVPNNPTADRAALGALAVYCERFSPRVGWETLTPARRVARQPPEPPWYGSSPGHLFFDVTGVAPLFGGETVLAERVVDDCRTLGYAGSVAIADTVGGAWAFATESGPFVIAPPGDLAAVLRPLSVSSLRLPANILELLARLGIATVEQLLRLSRAGLAERFGKSIGLWLDQALGTAPELIVPHRPAAKFEADVRLDWPTERRDQIDHLFASLIEEITTCLDAHGLGAMRLTVDIDCCQNEKVKFEVKLYRPAASAKQLCELLRLHCDRLSLPGPVERIRLKADRTAPLECRQGELFTGFGATREWGELLERLANRLGVDRVLRPVRTADALPERAVRYVLLVEKGDIHLFPSHHGGRLRAAGTREKMNVPFFRPLRLVTPPLRIDVVTVLPDCSPAAIQWHGRRHLVARRWGPERIETGWWRHGTVRRDYFRVETDAGCRFWIFRDLTDDAWYLHGSFE